MPKIETPEEFVTRIYEEAKNIPGKSVKDAQDYIAKALTTRDAALTDKVREECAETEKEALLIICQLCKRLNPQHPGNPDTCHCNDTQFLRAAIVGKEGEENV